MPKAFKSVAVAAARHGGQEGREDPPLDVRKTSPVDYIIATALSRPHPRRLRTRSPLISKDRDARSSPQPAATDLWRVLDYGGLIIHLMVGARAVVRA